MSKKISLIPAFVFVFIFATSVFSQIEEEVTIIEQIGTRNSRCHGLENGIIDEEKFKKLKADKSCSQIKFLEPDFSAQTLIGYHVGGDCFLTVDTTVFRNYKTMTYTVKIYNQWGRCRASGSFQGFLLIGKIPADYKLEFEEIKVEDFKIKGM